MQTRTVATLTAVALTSTLALAGCSSTAGSGSSSSSSSSSSGMSGMSMPASSSARTTAAAAANNSADVLFAQMMVMHHLQAIQMSDTVLKKSGVDPKVTALAKKIKQAQSPEIDQMNGFLTSWGQEKVTSGSMGGMSMSGMMSQSDMDALEKASGPKASSLFLTQMIAHHSSAIAMAKDEVEKGKNPRAVALAKKIVADQSAEITTMKDLLKQV